jgi:CheY-like chemotaxis protein
MKIKTAVPILIADDDSDDQEMIRDALKESHLLNELFFVQNGEELLDFLNNKQNYTDSKKFPQPGLILLDLNMPRMDGREALRKIKSDPNLRRIPVVVLTTSEAEEDVFKTYNLGVNSFITKPVTFDGLVRVMSDIGRYWFEIVELPKENSEK